MSFPDMTDALGDWTEPARFRKVTKTVSDYEVEETVKEEHFDGVLVPLEKQKVQLKPEGQRTWKWYQLITDKRLKLDDIVENQEGTEFRVMAIESWAMAGFYNYDLTEKAEA